MSKATQVSFSCSYSPSRFSSPPPPPGFPSLHSAPLHISPFSPASPPPLLNPKPSSHHHRSRGHWPFDAFVDDAHEVRVLQCCGDPFFVPQLLVHCRPSPSKASSIKHRMYISSSTLYRVISNRVKYHIVYIVSYQRVSCTRTTTSHVPNRIILCHVISYHIIYYKEYMVPGTSYVPCTYPSHIIPLRGDGDDINL